MNNKEQFKSWVFNNLTENSGAGSSYISSIDWLSDRFYEKNKISKKSIFEIDDIDIISELHSEVKKIQRDKNSFIYNKDAPSYGERYFYSASLSKYKEFLQFKSGSSVSKKTERKTTIIDARFDVNSFSESLFDSGLVFSERLIIRFVSALLTKPFVILTGLSGSGKTKLAQAFAMWLCEDASQYCIVPVGADWTNREPLLGFPNALESGKYVKPDNGVLDLIIAANTNKSKPYFLILDEMNLSHVERYFADFLSVMESNGQISLHSGNGSILCDGTKIPPEISLPKNLFLIGTVNIDETTYMFSPKVLDRANVIEFRVNKSEMESFLINSTNPQLNNLAMTGATMAESFIDIAKNLNLQTKNQKELNTALIQFFVELKKSGAEFGYRSANEIKRFVSVVNEIEPSWSISEIIDAAILQKLLPKVHGSRRKLEPILKTLATLCITESQVVDELIFAKSDIQFDDKAKIKYPLSLEKILRMYNGLIDNGFTSYAEA